MEDDEMRSGNPALSAKTFEQYRNAAGAAPVAMDAATGATRPSAIPGAPTAAAGAGRMTLQGTVNKALLMIGILVLTGAWVWNLFFQNPDNPALVMPYLWTGLIGGLIVAMVTIFKPTWAPVTAPAYAGLEGLALGAISAFMEARFPGIVMQAVGLTVAVFVALLMAYTSGLIKPTENFKLGIVAATGGIFLVYMVNLGMQMFGFGGMGFIHDSGPIGIGFSLVVVTIAALNLVLDFDFIEEGAIQGAPKFMEWYGAFGLLVTLVWLYIEILHLLSKLRQ
jgi:uncharacterized YccA/Bax inhibitor family protein